MENEIKRLEEEFQRDFQQVKSPKDLETLKIKYLGRKSTFTQLFSRIPTLAKEERGAWGKRLNAFKQKITSLLEGKISQIKSKEEKISLVKAMLDKYKEIAEYHNISPNIRLRFPIIEVNQSWFNLETLEWQGEEDEEVDDFRDYVRKWGFRFYGRPFKSAF